MQQGRADRVSQAALTVANPELALVWQKGLSADLSLSREEFTQWMLLCRAAFLSGEDSFMQYKAGLLSKPAYGSYVAGVSAQLSNPALRAAWQLCANQFG